MDSFYVLCFILSTPGYVVYVNEPWLVRSVASQCCQFHGMNLVQIDSLTKNDFIGNMVHQMSGQRFRAWIGLYKTATNGTFKWENGEDLDFERWGPGQPGDVNPCVCGIFDGNDFKWSDIHCDAAYPYVCEYTEAAEVPPIATLPYNCPGTLMFMKRTDFTESSEGRDATFEKKGDNPNSTGLIQAVDVTSYMDCLILCIEMTGCSYVTLISNLCTIY